MVMVFCSALFVSSAALAMWIDVRMPSLAPSRMVLRVFFAVLALEACTRVPIENDSYLGLYVSVFGALLPLLVLMWLGALWVLRAVSEALAARY